MGIEVVFLCKHEEYFGLCLLYDCVFMNRFMWRAERMPYIVDLSSRIELWI